MLSLTGRKIQFCIIAQLRFWCLSFDSKCSSCVSFKFNLNEMIPLSFAYTIYKLVKFILKSVSYLIFNSFIINSMRIPCGKMAGRDFLFNSITCHFIFCCFVTQQPSERFYLIFL